jgi:LPS-assembly lipoprotein
LLFNRHIIILSGLLLGACGFQPLYGTKSAGQVGAEFSKIRIAAIPVRIGQQLRNELDRLLHPGGQSQRSLYRLRATLKESTSSLAVKKSAFATRANLTMSVSYSLTQASREKALVNASNAISVSYNIFNSEFETLMAEKDARKRAVRELAQEIRVRLGVYFRSAHKNRPGAS